MNQQEKKYLINRAASIIGALKELLIKLVTEELKLKNKG